MTGADPHYSGTARLRNRSEALLDSLRPSVETVMLEPGRDGVHQMAQFLRHRRGVQAIHVVSHGGPGTLGLGAGVLDAKHPTNVRARELAVLGAALAEGGDILIYGCSFGAGRAGRAAVRARTSPLPTIRPVAPRSAVTGTSRSAKGKSPRVPSSLRWMASPVFCSRASIRQTNRSASR